MASSDDDEDMRRAIALSLQDERQTARKVISLDSEDDDNVPSQTSKGAQLAGKDITFGITSDSNGKTSASESVQLPSGLSFLGIDRKKMEQERLARKRKASVSPPPARKAPKTSPSRPVKSHNLVSQSATDSASLISTNSQGSLKGKSPLESLFLQGTIKKTWAFGYPREGDDIKFEEVLQKNDLNLAVLSSFQWEIDWLLAKMNTRSTQITLVMQAKEQATKDQYRRETAAMPNLRLCFPSMEGQVNCMHSKLMLLSHPTHLRIAIPTANLVPYDWGDSGDMENMVFIIDLPRLSDWEQTADDMTPFGRELIYFLKAMGLEQSIIESISSFDFSATKDLAFVHTIGGVHLGNGEPWRNTGYCGLGRAVRELGLAIETPLKLDFVTSSVGSLNVDFLSMLYLAAQGDDGTTEYGWRNTETGRGKAKRSKAELAEAEAAQEEIQHEVRENFHTYFPTRDTVKASTAGGAGTICFQSKWYNLSTFPRQVLRDCKSTRPGLLMHNKIIYVHRNEKATSKTTDEDSGSTSWAYVGSANCSESAWGKLFKDRTTKAPKLNCRNWECGVIIPCRRAGKRDARGGLGDFEGIVPVPMEYPGQVYGNRKPWYFSEQ